MSLRLEDGLVAKGRKALVTGGNGYIGSALLRSLQSAGIEAHAVAHRNRNRLDSLLPPNQVHPAADDAALASLVRDLQPDAIFHLAAHHANSVSHQNLTAMIEANIAMGTALLHGATACKCKPVFINTGSYWQFADGEAYSPLTFYAASKQSFQDILLYFSRCYDVPTMTLVLYETFGPDDDRPELWNKLLDASPGSKFPLTGGEQLVELVHVEDVVRAYLVAAEMLMRGEGLDRCFAVRSTAALTLRELVESWQSGGLINLRLDWGAIPYPSTQVFNPWQGEILPGWVANRDSREAMIELVRARVAGGEGATRP